jgi:hypothetical protein
MRPLFEEYFSEQRLYQPLFFAYNLGSEPITADLYQCRNPYANPTSIQEVLNDAVEAGYLEPVSEGKYKPSQKGTSAIEIVHESFYGYINQLDHFPDDQLKELCSLLAKLVESVSQADLGDRKLCFEVSSGGHIPVEHGTLSKVDQHLDDLYAFRDDAHIAAWKSTGGDGHIWEVLTFVWNGDANTPEGLVERLPYRQYTAENYRDALDTLAQKGWIEVGTEGYVVTPEGKKIRDEAEEATDRNYFAPWKALNDVELKRLGELLTALKEANLKIIPPDDAD